MLRKLAFAFFALMFGVLTAAQDGAPRTPRPALAQPPSVTFYYAGPGVASPTIVSSSISIEPPRKCVRYIGVVTLSAVIDENGMPRSMNLLSGDARLTNVAIDIVNQQRFRPGSYNGIRVPVAIQATIGMQTCTRPLKDSANTDDDEFTLCAHPVIALSMRAKP